MKQWAVWAVALAAGAGLVRADEGLDAWLKGYPAKLDALQTVQEQGEYRIEMTMGGMKSQQIMELEFRYRRPDGLVAKGPFAEIYCLGTNAVFFQKMMKQEYRRQTVPGGLPEFLEDVEAEMLMLSSDKQVLLKTDAEGRAEALDGFFTSDQARRLPDEELDGRMCAVFVDQMESMFQASWAKIWVDAETGLLRRLESIPVPEWVKPEAADDEEEEEVAEMLRNMKMTYVVQAQRVNEEIPDAAFVFTPPEGAKEEMVTPEEQEAEEIERAAGLERFELSGQAAPDFTLPQLDGGTFTLAEQKGKVVVIDFWATWCGPCVRALPEMKKLAEAYADNPDVVVVGFSTDEEKNLEKVKKVAEKNQLPYPVGLGPAEVKTAYKVRGIPCLVVVGKDGAVQGRHVGFSPGLAKQLQKTVDRLLAGETLESAKPYTAEELKKREEGVCPKCGKVHGTCGSGRRGDTKLDARLFKERWSQAAPAGDVPPRSTLGSSRGVDTRIAPKHLVRLDGQKAVVLDVADGQVVHTVELPAEMCVTNEQGEVPTLVYLRTPAGGTIAGYQEFYRVEKKGTSTTYHNRKRELFGIPLAAGSEMWRHAQDESSSFRSLSALPVAENEDLLAATGWNEIRFYDGAGKEILKQAMAYNTEAFFAQDAAGKPVLYLLGPKTAMYEVVWPPAAPATEAPAEPVPVEPPAEPVPGE